MIQILSESEIYKAGWKDTILQEASKLYHHDVAVAQKRAQAMAELEELQNAKSPQSATSVPDDSTKVKSEHTDKENEKPELSDAQREAVLAELVSEEERQKSPTGSTRSSESSKSQKKRKQKSKK